MEQFAFRIKIVNIEGAEIAYLHTREGFDHLHGLKVKDDGDKLIQIGSEFTYLDIRYKVEDINFKMLSKLYLPDESNLGTTIYSPDILNEGFTLNCQMNVIVEAIEG